MIRLPNLADKSKNKKFKKLKFIDKAKQGACIGVLNSSELRNILFFTTSLCFGKILSEVSSIQQIVVGWNYRNIRLREQDHPIQLKGCEKCSVSTAHVRPSWRYMLEGTHTARASNLRHDLITAKFSSVIPKQSDWSIMISQSGEGNININDFATLIWH